MTETKRTGRKNGSTSRRRNREESQETIMIRRMAAARRRYNLEHPEPMFPHDDGKNPTTSYAFWTVVDKTACLKCEKEAFVACFEFYRLEGGRSYGICNERALAAGMTHPISPRALNIG